MKNSELANLSDVDILKEKKKIIKSVFAYGVFSLCNIYYLASDRLKGLGIFSDEKLNFESLIMPFLFAILAIGLILEVLKLKRIHTEISKRNLHEKVLK